jgi:hypothetical protein
MLQWLIRDVEVEIHVAMGVSLRFDFIEAAFFMLHLREFDVALVLF